MNNKLKEVLVGIGINVLKDVLTTKNPNMETVAKSIVNHGLNTIPDQVNLTNIKQGIRQDLNIGKKEVVYFVRKEDNDE